MNKLLFIYLPLILFSCTERTTSDNSEDKSYTVKDKQNIPINIGGKVTSEQHASLLYEELNEIPKDDSSHFILKNFIEHVVFNGEVNYDSTEKYINLYTDYLMQKTIKNN